MKYRFGRKWLLAPKNLQKSGNRCRQTSSFAEKLPERTCQLLFAWLPGFFLARQTAKEQSKSAEFRIPIPHGASQPAALGKFFSNRTFPAKQGLFAVPAQLALPPKPNESPSPSSSKKKGFVAARSKNRNCLPLLFLFFSRTFRKSKAGSTPLASYFRKP